MTTMGRPVVLKVLNKCKCDGCFNKIRNGMNSIKDLEEVERIWKDYNTGMITVYGTMDPQMLRDKLASKTEKPVEIVFLPTGNSPEIMASSNHVHVLPSAPPISEMMNSTSAVQSRSRNAQRIRQLEDELEQYRRLIRLITIFVVVAGLFIFWTG